MLNNNAEGYGLVAIVLHWLTALMIIALFFLGFFMVDLDYQSAWYHRAPMLHIGLGLCLLMIMLVRLVWWFCSRAPKPLPSLKAWQKITAKVIKLLLVVIVFLILISGYFIASEHSAGPSFFDWFNFPLLFDWSAKNIDRLGEVHELLAFTVMFIAMLHAGAALVHHYFYRDKTLVRMLVPVAKTRR